MDLDSARIHYLQGLRVSVPQQVKWEQVRISFSKYSFLHVSIILVDLLEMRKGNAIFVINVL